MPTQLRDLHHEILALGQELVQRRVNGPDGDGLAVHRLEDAVEVLALQRQEFLERRPSIGFVVGKDHALDDRDASLAEEHVLGPAQADPVRPEGKRDLRLVRLIGVRSDLHPAKLVGPGENLHETAVDVGLLRRKVSRARPAESRSASTSPSRA